MESDAKKPNQVTGSERQEELESRQRPYECTFCKRGFSNAQALGGHMNIHRKDKAKLNQTANSDQIPIVMPTTIDETSLINVYNCPWINRGAVHEQAGSHDQASSTTNKRDPNEEFKKIPFFADKQLSGNQNQNPSPSTVVIGSLTSNVSSSLKLDLELRLGPADPPPDSPKGTKKFF